jgi:hypothetical protein
VVGAVDPWNPFGALSMRAVLPGSVFDGSTHIVPFVLVSPIS